MRENGYFHFKIRVFFEINSQNLNFLKEFSCEKIYTIHLNKEMGASATSQIENVIFRHFYGFHELLLHCLELQIQKKQEKKLVKILHYVREKNWNTPLNLEL